MTEEIRQDFNKLVAYCLPRAEHFLERQNGEFYPFAAYIDNNDSVIPTAFYDGDEFPLSDTLIQELKKVLEDRMQKGEIIAYSITYDTRVGNDKYPEKIDAVTMRMRHRDSSDVFIFYFPYKLNDNEIQFLESFGEIESA